MAKPKRILILMIFSIVIFITGVTYSFFTSNTDLTGSDKFIAKFVFNAEPSESITLPLADIKPGDSQIFPFAVTNTGNSITSDVNIEYQITIKTYHLMPLSISLYKLGTPDTLIINCDENYDRNTNNEIVCNAPSQTLNYNAIQTDNYELRVNFPSIYNSPIYQGLVDYITLDIKSQQKGE